MTVGILGGGLTGLTLGFLIEDSEILERENECGGLCRSTSEEGFTFDCFGSHIIFSRDREVLNFMLRMLGDNVVKCRRNTKILYNGRLVKYPFENGLADLPLRENLKCVASFLFARAKKCLHRCDGFSSFHEYLLANFGGGISSKYLIPYNEKIWKRPISDLNASWAAGRVPSPSVFDVLRSSLGFNSEGYTHQLNFYYPKRGGIEALINSIERKCADKTVCNFEVKAIWHSNDKWYVSNGEECMKYDKIVATIPVFSVVDALREGGENVPASVVHASRRLSFNSLITVMIGLEGEPPVNARIEIEEGADAETGENMRGISWLYIPDADCLPHRVAFPSNYSKYVAPEGKTAVLAEITCACGSSGIWNMSDHDIMERTINDLNRKGILNRNYICFAKVVRAPLAYIIYDRNYERNVLTLREYFGKKGIILAGRFAKFEYMNMDDCVKDAIEIARMLVA